jgi:Spy/CpxP family protein refolding chaperone
MSPLNACRRLLPIVIGGAVCASSTLVLAGPPAGPGASSGKAGERLCKKLSCTDAQEGEVAAIVTDLRTETKADREAIRALHGEVMAEYAKAKPDQAKMKAAYAKIDAHRASIRDHVHDAAMELHAVLKPAQRQELAEMLGERGLEKMLKGGHGRHGNGKGKGGKAKPGKAE